MISSSGTQSNVSPFSTRSLFSPAPSFTTFSSLSYPCHDNSARTAVPGDFEPFRQRSTRHRASVPLLDEQVQRVSLSYEDVWVAYGDHEGGKKTRSGVGCCTIPLLRK